MNGRPADVGGEKVTFYENYSGASRLRLLQRTRSLHRQTGHDKIITKRTSFTHHFLWYRIPHFIHFNLALAGSISHQGTMNTGDEGRGTLILLSSACTIHNTCVRAGAVPVWVGDDGWVSSKLALIISMSALVSFSELLLALVSSSELCPLYPVSRAGGWWGWRDVCPAEVSNNKEAVTHPHQPPARPQNWKLKIYPPIMTPSQQPAVTTATWAHWPSVGWADECKFLFMITFICVHYPTFNVSLYLYLSGIVSVSTGCRPQ